MSNTTHPIRCCPVPNCSWKPTNPPTQKQNKKETILQLKQHLIQAHNDTPLSDHIDETYCKRHGFHACLQCNKPTTIFTTPGHLRNHQENKHTRTTTNLQIVLNTYRHADNQTAHNWKAAIDFLHHLEITPPPFRRTIWHKLKHPLRKEYFVAYHNVVRWILEATPPLRNDTKRDTRPSAAQTDSSPFWKLLLLMEPLFLAPPAATEHKRPSEAIRACHQLFKEGKIQELYDAIWQPPANRQPGQQPTPNQGQEHQHAPPPPLLPESRRHRERQTQETIQPPSRDSQHTCQQQL